MPVAILLQPAIARLGIIEDALQDAKRPLRLSLGIPVLATYISGPSATADIEMTRIKGVHGPRFLNVILAQRG
jgi:L-lactate dehydrogenase complex protein LldG